MSTLAIVLYWLLAVVLVLLGVVGLLLPGLPGAPLLFGGLLLAAWIEGFVYVGPWTLALLALMAVATYAIDFFAGALGTKGFGATRYAMFGAFLGALVGIFFGLPGILLGPFIGAVLGELLADRSMRQAGAAGLGATIGLALGVAAKMALAFSMIGIYVLVRLWGGLA